MELYSSLNEHNSENKRPKQNKEDGNNNCKLVFVEDNMRILMQCGLHKTQTCKI